MGQIIKVQRPVSSASISGLYVILEAAFTIALLGVLLYKLHYLGNVNFKHPHVYPINHIRAEILTTGWIIPPGTNSLLYEVTTQ
jgi:hypothetical protein